MGTKKAGCHVYVWTDVNIDLLSHCFEYFASLPAPPSFILLKTCAIHLCISHIGLRPKDDATATVLLPQTWTRVFQPSSSSHSI
jgi:hypothetical protein